jgi:hypothetical protein
MPARKLNCFRAELGQFILLLLVCLRPEQGLDEQPRAT